jgi:hypothetical protein
MASAVQLARDVLRLAEDAGMPDSYWTTDSRTRRAVAVLGWEDWTRQQVAEEVAGDRARPTPEEVEDGE